VIPTAFQYERATSLDDALVRLWAADGSAKLLAGGHSLIPLMKLRLTTPKHVVDLKKVTGLSGVREEGGTIVIGALTTHYMIESNASLKTKCPLLTEAAAMIGDPQVRNWGTIGGSLAHADPAADWPAVVLALGAELVATGARGKRTIKADDFFKGLMTTALGADEILTEVRIPVPAAGAGTAYLKHPHPASRFAVVGVAAVLTVSGGKCERASVAVTGAPSKVTRAKGVEAALAGKPLDAQTIAAAAEKAADGIDASADLQGSVEYKQHLVRVYTRRALEAAASRVRK
jgi:aerobic carbon-monoxide dehydrogenase medium subunit